MKRNFRTSALSIIALVATVLSIPAQGQSLYGRSRGQNNAGAGRTGAPQQLASRDRNDGGNRAYSRGYQNGAYDHGNNRGYEYRDDNGAYGYRNNERDYGYGGGYVTPGYSYYGDGGYGYGDGRSAAIIGGSAAAGALIGGATGHGQGAVLGAVVGGIAGMIADQAVRHHDYR